MYQFKAQNLIALILVKLYKTNKSTSIAPFHSSYKVLKFDLKTEAFQNCHKNNKNRTNKEAIFQV